MSTVTYVSEQPVTHVPGLYTLKEKGRKTPLSRSVGRGAGGELLLFLQMTYQISQIEKLFYSQPYIRLCLFIRDFYRVVATI